MAGPLIGVVVTFVATKGMQAATRKYGKKAVDKALQFMYKQINPSKVKTAKGNSGEGMQTQPGTIRVNRKGEEVAVFGKDVIQAYKNVARNQGLAIGSAATVTSAGLSSNSKSKKEKEKLSELEAENNRLREQAKERMRADAEARAKQEAEENAKRSRERTSQMMMDRENMGGR